MLCGSSVPAAAQRAETILHTFSWDTDGGFPFAGPTMDSQEKIYGVGY
jgi:hypothetical protein